MDPKTFVLAAAAIATLGATAFAAYRTLTAEADAATLADAVAETERRQTVEEKRTSFPGLELVMRCRKHHFTIDAATRYPTASLRDLQAALDDYEANGGFTSPGPILAILAAMSNVTGTVTPSTRRPWLALVAGCRTFGVTLNTEVRYTTTSLEALDAAMDRHATLVTAAVVDPEEVSAAREAVYAAISGLTTEAVLCASLA